MARQGGRPVFHDRCAPEELRHEVAEQVSEHEEHDRPGAEPESGADAEEAKVKEENAEFVAKEADDIDRRGSEDPLVGEGRFSFGPCVVLR